MLSNLHQHTTFSDGKDTAEQVVLSAIDMGLRSIGFSDHGYTPRDLTYCMKDQDGYIKEVKRLKEKYKDKIQVYLGIEEDIINPLDRKLFDYIIGSAHYLDIDGKVFPIDSNPQKFRECKDICGGDPIRFANTYFPPFVEHILKYKPDIIGHFDLLTKFDELDGENIFFSNKEYTALVEKYALKACESGSLFEVNTGAISRGYRTTPYPAENLLHLIKKHGAGVTITADSHAKETIVYSFDLARQILKDVGFTYTYVLFDGEFKKDYL